MLPSRPRRAAMLAVAAVFYMSVCVAVHAAEYNAHAPYDKDPWESKHSEYSKYSGDDKYYNDEYKKHTEYKDISHYGQHDDMQLMVDGCLQWTGPDPNQELNSTTYRSQFRCCKKEDDPHVCLERHYAEEEERRYAEEAERHFAHGEDRYAHEEDRYAHEEDRYAHEEDRYAHGEDRYAHEEDRHTVKESYGNSHSQSHNLLDSLSQIPAAVCSWSFDGPGCPSHMMDTCVGHGWLNCTTSSAAPECDIPKYLSFSSKGYFIAQEARSCEPFFDATSATNRLLASNTTGDIFRGVAWIFKGKIHGVDSSYGYQKAKGSVEFVAHFGENPPVNQSVSVASANYGPSPHHIEHPDHHEYAEYPGGHEDAEYPGGHEDAEYPDVHERHAYNATDAYHDEEEYLGLVKGGSLHFTIWTKKY